MLLLNELDNLYKVELQKVEELHKVTSHNRNQGSDEMKLQNELHRIEKRKEIVKTESELLLDRCVSWQNGGNLLDYV
jgi:hypothetical protein